MSITVTFYTNFEKRLNSTKQPLNTDSHTDYTCTLKEGCNILTPEIEIYLSSGDPSSYNYAYIPSFKRYYFVNDWTYFHGVWTASLSVDVLASFKTGIGNLSKYVVRSSYTSNGDIIDGFYHTEADLQRSIIPSTSPFSTGIQGTYIVGIIGEQPNANVPCVGGVCYYALSFSQMAELINYLMSSTFSNIMADPANGMTDSITKVLMNPTQYIASCIWIPYSITTTAVSVQPKIGWWNTSPLSSGCNALGSGGISSLQFSKVGTNITVTSHSQIARGAYLDCAPYSRYIFHLEPWGDIELNSNFIMKNKTVSYTITTDGMTGMGRLDITSGTKVISSNFAQVGVPIAISEILQTADISVGGIVASLTGALAAGWDALTGGGSLKDAGSAAVNAVESYNTDVNVKGVNGSAISYTGVGLGTGADAYNTQGPYIRVDRFDLVPEDNAEFGRPLFDIRTVSNIPGFIKCADGEHNIAGYENEKSQISGYLTGGFFYE